MSYLDRNRIHFMGEFQADVSTVNNTPENYDVSSFTPEDQKQGLNPPEARGSWNPEGSGAWRFRNCYVTAAMDGRGKVADDPSEDPVIGALVGSADDRVAGKLVDLDSQQQMVSQIWGLRIRISLTDGGWVEGSFLPVAFRNVWIRLFDGSAQAVRGDNGLAAQYESALYDLKWSYDQDNQAPPEGVMGALYRESHDALSIKFNVDCFQADSSQADFTMGRVVGTIGPSGPLQFHPDADGNPPFESAPVLNPTPDSPLLPPGLRLMHPPSGAPFSGKPVLNEVPFVVDEAEKEVVLDLGNSVPCGLLDRAPLWRLYRDVRLVMIHPDGLEEVVGDPQFGRRAVIDRAGIQNLDLTADQLKSLTVPDGEGRFGRLCLATVRGGRIVSRLVSENEDAVVLLAEQFVYRMDPEGTGRVRLLALKAGKPFAGQPVTLMQNTAGTLGPGQTALPLGVPESALQIHAERATNGTTQVPEHGAVCVTDEHGWAEFVLTAGDTRIQGQYPRAYIDGQLYGLSYACPGSNDPAWGPDGTAFVSVIVRSTIDVPDEPSWTMDIQPILQQYDNLYPVMARMVNLGDESSVRGFGNMISMAMGLSMYDPNFMPVTRDLSTAKREMIIKWLAQVQKTSKPASDEAVHMVSSADEAKQPSKSVSKVGGRAS